MIISSQNFYHRCTFGQGSVSIKSWQSSSLIGGVLRAEKFCYEKESGHYTHPGTRYCFIQCDHVGRAHAKLCARGTSWRGESTSEAAYANMCTWISRFQPSSEGKDRRHQRVSEWVGGRCLMFYSTHFGDEFQAINCTGCDWQQNTHRPVEKTHTKTKPTKYGFIRHSGQKTEGNFTEKLQIQQQC